MDYPTKRLSSLKMCARAASFLSFEPRPSDIIMLVEKIYLSSTIDAERDGLALVVAACEMLGKEPTTVDELWPGEMHDCPS